MQKRLCSMQDYAVVQEIPSWLTPTHSTSSGFNWAELHLVIASMLETLLTSLAWEILKCFWHPSLPPIIVLACSTSYIWQKSQTPHYTYYTHTNSSILPWMQSGILWCLWLKSGRWLLAISSSAEARNFSSVLLASWFSWYAVILPLPGLFKLHPSTTNSGMLYTYVRNYHSVWNEWINNTQIWIFTQKQLRQ